MPVISARVDDELKKKMDKYKYINWSEIIRTEIVKIIGRLEGRNIAEALLINERLRRRLTTRLEGKKIYDASYIALAEELKAKLYTADEKLIRKANIDFVKHISEF